LPSDAGAAPRVETPAGSVAAATGTVGAAHYVDFKLVLTGPQDVTVHY